MASIFATIRRAFHAPDDPLHQRVELVVWVLIVLSIAITLVEVGFELSPAQHDALVVVDRVLLVVFVIEIVLRVASFQPPEVTLFADTPARRLRVHVMGRIGYLLRPLTMVDVVAVLALHPSLRGLRALRALRLLRTFKVFKYANPFAHLGAALQDNGLLYLFALGILAVETLVGGVTLYLVEGDGSNPEVTSIWDGMWWALVTLTTVGYGDITPGYALGRVMAGVLMVAGMFTLALFAGVVGHTLLHTVLTLREEQFRMTKHADHVVVFGYTAGARMLLDALSEELHGLGAEVVLMGTADRPKELPPSFRWIVGDPSKEQELDKVHLTHAHTVLFVGDRTLGPAQADASTILGLFTVRSYLRKQLKDRPRTTPIHLVAEVLDAENVEHARTAGAAEVIESTRVGFALLAHTVAEPGTAEVMSRVVSAGAHSVYVADGEPYVGSSVLDVHRVLKDEHGVLLMGLRDPATGADRLNPPNDTVVGPKDQLLYLANKALLPHPPGRVAGPRHT